MDGNDESDTEWEEMKIRDVYVVDKNRIDTDNKRKSSI